jgi:hypothetical protein
MCAGSDFLARTYLDVRGDLGVGHAVTRAYFAILNTVECARQEGAENMLSLLSSASHTSYRLRNGAKNKYIEQSYARDHPILEAFFAADPLTQLHHRQRFACLSAAAVILGILAVWMYFDLRTGDAALERQTAFDRLHGITR